MTMQQSSLRFRALSLRRRTLSGALLDRIVHRLIGELPLGQLVVETPGHHYLVLRGTHPGPSAQLSIHHTRFLWRLLRSGDVGFAQSYMAGEWSTPDLHALLTVLNARFQNNPTARMPKLRAARRVRHALNRNTRRGSRRNIAAHYDLGNAFYRCWLDSGMNYSSALFSAGPQSLEQAQDAKLQRVTELLALRGGEDVLEIGCGWGSLALRLAQHHACRVLALTLSTEQLAFARQQLAAEIDPRCEFRLQDYRDVEGRFDRIASIEMLEAVGEAYWPAFFAQVSKCLRPNGIAVLQVISIAEGRFATYRRRPDFIQRHIFPGGMLPTPSIIEREAARAGLSLDHSEFFGSSYARTLAEWHSRFQAAWPSMKTLGFDDRFKRMWEYYLAYCQVGFETGVVDVGLYRLVRSNWDGKSLAPQSGHDGFQRHVPEMMPRVAWSVPKSSLR
jgi:cyclopropane-fatty-acyl-phospholipid synthase